MSGYLRLVQGAQAICDDSTEWWELWMHVGRVVRSQLLRPQRQKLADSLARYGAAKEVTR